MRRSELVPRWCVSTTLQMRVSARSETGDCASGKFRDSEFDAELAASDYFGCNFKAAELMQ